MALFFLGLEKSPSWDGVIAEFVKEFWPRFSKPRIEMAKRAFMEGKMEESISKGPIKPISKLIRCYLLKN